MYLSLSEVALVTATAAALRAAAASTLTTSVTSSGVSFLRTASVRAVAFARRSCALAQYVPRRARPSKKLPTYLATVAGVRVPLRAAVSAILKPARSRCVAYLIF